MPILGTGQPQRSDDYGPMNVDAKIKLRKKEVQLLGYATGEMYLDKEYRKLSELCERALDLCELDLKTIKSVQRWKESCLERMSQASSG